MNLTSDLSDWQTTFISSGSKYLPIMSSSPPPAHDLHASQRSQASASASSEYDTDQDASFDDDMEFDLAQELLEGEEMEDDEDYEGVIQNCTSVMSV